MTSSFDVHVGNFRPGNAFQWLVGRLPRSRIVSVDTVKGHPGGADEASRLARLQGRHGSSSFQAKFKRGTGQAWSSMVILRAAWSTGQRTVEPSAPSYPTDFGPFSQ